MISAIVNLVCSIIKEQIVAVSSSKSSALSTNTLIFSFPIITATFWKPLDFIIDSKAISVLIFVTIASFSASAFAIASLVELSLLIIASNKALCRFEVH